MVMMKGMVCRDSLKPILGKPEKGLGGPYVSVSLAG
jgi:hypothetical protein